MDNELKKIDVFIDLEGVGRLEGCGQLIDNVSILAERLPPSLASEGFELASLTGFASYYSCFGCGDKLSGKMVPHPLQSDWKKAFAERGWKMLWSDVIADEALISHVSQRLADSILAPAVMIITSDHDFVRLIQELVNSGRYVLVSGQNMSKGLRTHASKAISIIDFLGARPYRDFIRERVSARSALPNGIQLPEL